MPAYIYQAKKGPQNTVEGRVDAQSEKEAIEKLSLLGLVPVSLREEIIASVPIIQPLALSPVKSGVRINSREITVFSRQLASLLKSGVPILRAIVIIRDQATNRNMKAILQDIYKDVESGSPFSSVLSKYPRVFPPLYLALISAGENSGALP
ncbi:MAG: type II secretion system F family protein, partial [Candidatus Omnitrophota bacterium]